MVNMSEYISCKQVDKEAKVFYAADEYLMHTFKFHLVSVLSA